MSDITYEIKTFVGVISENEKSGWKKEANIVSWNGSQPKLDIREWSPDHRSMSRGITLTEQEAQNLVDLFRDYKHMKR